MPYVILELERASDQTAWLHCSSLRCGGVRFEIGAILAVQWGVWNVDVGLARAEDGTTASLTLFISSKKRPYKVLTLIQRSDFPAVTKVLSCNTTIFTAGI